MKSIFAAILFAVSLAARGETVVDDTFRFSIDAPQEAVIERGATAGGSTVSVVFRDQLRQEAVALRARRLTKGGKFGVPIPSIFNQIAAGMSSSMGTELAGPIRTFVYQGRTFYVATHLNLRTGSTKSTGVTTTGYFAEKDTWHKVILLQFMTDTNTALSDVELTERFARLKYQPDN